MKNGFIQKKTMDERHWIFHRYEKTSGFLNEQNNRFKIFIVQRILIVQMNLFVFYWTYKFY